LVLALDFGAPAATTFCCMLKFWLCNAFMVFPNLFFFAVSLLYQRSGILAEILTGKHHAPQNLGHLLAL
jgi:hypothetical protein